MIIGRGFTWTHIPKTAGDATYQLLAAVVADLIFDADPPTEYAKHTPFQERDGTRGDYVLGFRRLPAFILSHTIALRRYGRHPEYEPVPDLSPQALACSGFADDTLLWYTAGDALRISYWLRAEYLRDDLARFLTTQRSLSVTEVRRLRETPVKPPADYDHAIASWFTSSELQAMYAANPYWAYTESHLYGTLDETYQ